MHIQCPSVGQKIPTDNALMRFHLLHSNIEPESDGVRIGIVGLSILSSIIAAVLSEFELATSPLR